MTFDSKIIRRSTEPGAPPQGADAGIRSLMKSREEQQREAFGEAQAKGYSAGSEAGRNAFLQATAAAVQAIREDFFALEEMVAPLALQAAEKILGKLPRDQIARTALEEALREAGSSISVTLRVAPDDLDLMRTTWAQIASERPDLATTISAVEGDAGLRTGEMLLETLKGRMHFGVAYQLQRLKYSVLGSSS